MADVKISAASALSYTSVTTAMQMAVGLSGSPYRFSFGTNLAAMIAADALTIGSVPNSLLTRAKLSDMAANGFMGNDSGGAAAPQDLTVLEAQTLLMPQTPIAITGATTATINRYHTLAGTTADYTVTLPAAGTAGRRIAFYALDALTEIVTIDGNGSETIDGATTYKMAANDYLLIEDDGTNWRIIYQKSLIYVFADDNGGQVVTANTEDLDYLDNEVDTHQAWSGTQFTAPRSLVYNVTAACATTASSHNALRLAIDGTNADVSAYGNGSTSVVGFYAAPVKLNIGQTLSFRWSASETRDSGNAKNYIRIVGVV